MERVHNIKGETNAYGRDERPPNQGAGRRRPT